MFIRQLLFNFLLQIYVLQFIQQNIYNILTRMTQGAQNIRIQIVDETQKILDQHKQRMMPLVRFLRKHGLKFKHAACQGRRVEYFRMDNLNSLLQQKKQIVARDSKLSNLVQTIKEDLLFFKRPQNSQKRKYPQSLVINPGGKFAAFKFDTTESKKIYFVIVLIMILAGVLFPLWPYSLKYGLWIVSMVILVALVSIILLRLVLYVFLASFGISFWLFPNLFGDYGVLESLRPICSIEKWQTNIFSIILRVLCFSLFIYYCHSVYTQPEFYIENFDSAKEVVMEVHDWGVNKIKGDIGNFSQRALTMDKILNETADAFQEEQKDHYTSFEQPSTGAQENQETEVNEKQDEVQEQQNKWDDPTDEQDEQVEKEKQL